MFFNRYITPPKGSVQNTFDTLLEDKKFIIIPFCDPKSSLGTSLNSPTSRVFLDNSGPDIDIIYIKPRDQKHYEEFLQLANKIAGKHIRGKYFSSFIFVLSKYLNEVVIYYDISTLETNVVHSFLYDLIHHLNSTPTPLTLENIKQLDDFQLGKLGTAKLLASAKANSSVLFDALSCLISSLKP